MRHSKIEYEITTPKGEGWSFVMMACCLLLCMIPNLWLVLTEGMGVNANLINIILPCGLYLMLLSISQRVGRTVLMMIILLFLSAFQMVLLYLYGRSVIAVDMFLNVLTTNTTEVSELLNNMLPILILIIATFVPLLTLSVIGWVRGWTMSRRCLLALRWSGFSLTMVGLVLLVIAYRTDRGYDVCNNLYPLNAMYNIYLACDRTYQTSNSAERAAKYQFEANIHEDENAPRVMVLVVGETSRAANWEMLGYERETNPKLKDRDHIVIFPHVMSESNITHKSVPMLMSHLEASIFGDSIYAVSSIISAFKEAGYHTVYLSNQRRNHSLIDQFGEEADHTVFIKDDYGVHESDPYDEALLPLLEKELASNDGNLLVVLHTYGSHFCYIDRYPEGKAYFKPDRPLAIDATLRSNMINAYDNSIRYTSLLLDSIAGMLDEQNRQAVMIYTSDHGEDIFDDERSLFMHASAIPTARQLHVPLLVWMSEEYIASHPAKWQAILRNEQKTVSSSRSLFHTATDIAGIKTPVNDERLSLASEAYIPRARVFLNDHNKAVALDKCGFTREDYRYMRRYGLTF